MSLPQRFLEYLSQNGIDPSIYSIKLPRFVRWNTLVSPVDEEAVLKEFPTSKRLTGMYDSVFELDGDISVSTSTLYKSGKILGIDISSLVAIYALDLKSDDQFLDLCCAPGVKLSIAADLIGAKGKGSVTGVDISLPRLSVTRSLLKKLRIGKARLFCESGVTFDTLACSEVVLHQYRLEKNRSEIVKRTQKKPFYQSSVFQKERHLFDSFYDKVLCDVECTHDGSIKHIQKLMQNGSWDSFVNNLDSKNLEELYELQYDILCNGFRLLKRGGCLVYSTCSLSCDQNERIIERFKSSHDCVFEDLSRYIPEGYQCEINAQFIKFSPLNNTSGLFICKIRKA